MLLLEEKKHEGREFFACFCAKSMVPNDDCITSSGIACATSPSTSLRTEIMLFFRKVLFIESKGRAHVRSVRHAATHRNQRGILRSEGESKLPQVIQQADLSRKEVIEAVKQIKSHGNAPLPKNPKQPTLFQ